MPQISLTPSSSCDWSVSPSSGTFFAFDGIRNTVVTIVALPRDWEEGHCQNGHVFRTDVICFLFLSFCIREGKKICGIVMIIVFVGLKNHEDV